MTEGRRQVPYVYVVGVYVVPLLSFDVGLWQEVDPSVVICRGQRSEVTKEGWRKKLRRRTGLWAPTGQYVAVSVLVPVVGVVGGVGRHHHFGLA